MYIGVYTYIYIYIYVLSPHERCGERGHAPSHYKKACQKFNLANNNKKKDLWDMFTFKGHGEVDITNGKITADKKHAQTATKIEANMRLKEIMNSTHVSGFRPLLFTFSDHHRRKLEVGNPTQAQGKVAAQGELILQTQASAHCASQKDHRRQETCTNSYQDRGTHAAQGDHELHMFPASGHYSLLSLTITAANSR